MQKREAFDLCWRSIALYGWLNAQHQSWPPEVLHHFPSKNQALFYFVTHHHMYHSAELCSSSDMKDLCFDMVMSRLESLRPHRSVIIDISVHIPFSVMTYVAMLVRSCFYHDIQRYESVLRYKKQYYSTWLAGIYLSLLPSWVSDTEEVVMAHLDNRLNFLVRYHRT